jgi:mannose-6-phosphate isomerase-like protein (cupin superfamily)
MATTTIDTNQCRRVALPGAQGEMAEIVNEALCGAQNVVAMLRWLNQGERFDAERLADTHQLIYLMDGAGAIRLEDEDYEVAAGAGVYLGPGETASVRHGGSAPLKLLHLIVPSTGD